MNQDIVTRLAEIARLRERERLGSAWGAGMAAQDAHENVR